MFSLESTLVRPDEQRLNRDSGSAGADKSAF